MGVIVYGTLPLTGIISSYTLELNSINLTQGVSQYFPIIPLGSNNINKLRLVGAQISTKYASVTGNLLIRVISNPSILATTLIQLQANAGGIFSVTNNSFPGWSEINPPPAYDFYIRLEALQANETLTQIIAKIFLG